MSRQSLVRKEKVFKEHVEHHSECAAVLSIIHLLLQRTFPIMGAPACIPSTLSTCFLILQVPQPLPAPSPPPPSAHLDLNALSHYKPNITSHLLIVTSISFTKSFFSPLSQLPQIPQPFSYILAHPCPRCPTKYYPSPSVILSIPDCSTFPSCQNVLLSSTSSPKSL